MSDTKLLLFVYVTFVALFFVFFFWLSRFQFNNIESMCTYLFCLFWRGCISFSSKQKVLNVSNNDKELVSIFFLLLVRLNCWNVFFVDPLILELVGVSTKWKHNDSFHA